MNYYEINNEGKLTVKNPYYAYIAAKESGKTPCFIEMAESMLCLYKICSRKQYTSIEIVTDATASKAKDLPAAEFWLLERIIDGTWTNVLYQQQINKK